MVKDIQVLPNIGSDHFPVYGKFQYQPNNAQPTEPTPSSDDIHETLDKIAKNNPNQEVIKTKY
ncbi:hypothetical protein LU276_07505 [Moraxella haemolytica]|uniref:hypothetical protein n=1 Tax=Moraxella TaxID=475 RepID=UPI002542CD75|nr:hypothetical protein [Moraxella sp. ZY171148]WII94860.1 hypothetical protein LU276_07505 [Moraxella sp. ZY171148]